VTELAGKRRVDGIEFELTGTITPNWDVYSGVAFMDGKIVQATVNQGNTPLGVADWSATSGPYIGWAAAGRSEAVRCSPPVRI
jgi:catecholate siderophore receptor